MRTWHQVPRFILAVILIYAEKSQSAFPSRNIQLEPVYTDSLYNDCVLPVIKEAKPQNVHLMCSANSSFCPSNIVNRIPGIAWTYYDKPGEEVIAFQWKDLCIFSAVHIADLIQLFDQFQKCQRAKVVSLYSKNTSNHQKELEHLFNHAWKHGVTDVVAVNVGYDLCEVFTYYPFGKNSRCYDMSPVLMSSWERRLGLDLNNTIVYFPQNKVSNMHSCELQIEHLVSKSSTNVVVSRNGGLVPFVLSAMNARQKLVTNTNPQFPDVKDSKTSLLSGYFYQNARRTSKFVLSPVSFIQNFGVCLPTQKQYSVEWFRIMNEFPMPIWGCVVICFVATVVYVAFVSGEENDIARITLMCLQNLLNGGAPWARAKRWQDRVHLLSWLLSCTVINCAYLSSLKRNLAVPGVDRSTMGIEDFVHSNLPIYSANSTRSFTINYLNNTEVFRSLINKVEFLNVSWPDIYDHGTNKAAHICNYNDIDYYFKPGTYQGLPGVEMTSALSLLILPKPSPFEGAFTTAVLKSFDVGAFDLISDERWYEKSAPWNDDLKPFSLRALLAIFMIWVIGCVLSVLVFLLEVCQPVCFRPWFPR